MRIGQIRWLYAFNHWATARYLETLRGLPSELLTRHVESSYPSLMATLAHLVAAEWIWLRRWLGESPTRPPEWLTSPDLATLEGILAQVESERDGFLSGLDDTGLDRSIAYRRLDGEPGRERLDTLLLHVVNHSTYHRGQLATMLRRLGAVPPATDLVLFSGVPTWGG